MGSADEDGFRLIPLRDSLFILKEDGIYRLTGEDSASFRIELFDDTARIRAPETAVTLNNALFFLSDQGVVQCTETGVSVISRPIEIDILELFGEVGLSTVSAYSFAVGYETDRKYILAVPQTSADTSASFFHVYNTFTNAWTTWEDLDVVYGLVKRDNDKLYLCDSSIQFLREERKSYNNTDFIDNGGPTTISGVSDLTLTLSNTDLMSIGDIIYQSGSFSIIDSIDSIAGTVTINYDGGLSTGAAVIYKAINCDVTWVPIHAGNPSIIKQFREISFLFKRSFLLRANAAFSSDLSPSTETLTIQGKSLGFWGYFSWGDVIWGGAVSRFPVRTWVPLAKQRSTQLIVSFSHRVGYSDFKLSGMATHFRAISERFGNT